MRSGRRAAGSAPGPLRVFIRTAYVPSWSFETGAHRTLGDPGEVPDAQSKGSEMRITGRVVGRAVWVVTLALAASGLATPPSLGAQATPPSLGAPVIDV